MLNHHDRLRSERRVAHGKITVLVASAATEKRHRWQFRLQETFALCEVTERRALEQIMAHLEPHVLLLDMSLPGLEGAHEIARIQNLSPKTKIIALTSRSDDREALAALAAGARGYYSRDIEPGQLRKAVEVVEAGELWIQRRLVSVLLDLLRSAKQRRPDTRNARLQALTPREYQVAELITAGASNKDIARQLNVAERTVKAHLTELFRDLNVPDRLNLAVLLNREGLRSPSVLSRYAGTPRHSTVPLRNNGKGTRPRNAKSPEAS